MWSGFGSGAAVLLPVRPAVGPAGSSRPRAEFQVEGYAGKIRALSIFWFIYAGLSLVVGHCRPHLRKVLLSGGFGPWMNGPLANGPWAHGPFPPFWLGPAVLHLIWILLVLRAGLALAAGWGLMEHTQWGRLVAIVAAIFSLSSSPSEPHSASGP